MKIKELIEQLNLCDQEAHINFYNLENYDLQLRVLESIIPIQPACEGEVSTVEITTKPEGSDEGGNFSDDEWAPSAFN